ncbi:LruC domain-containing protein [Simiduia agarivorans]|uniref:LruC domain-containing protein n=1 Tax=Simiduia agarivorans (strain DSM 21679 / JCM 13881 / BCRC 17597 / SA1) TaxID=1117647 RepID=K4KH73_SIMAS|nr:LruC domain-containing protein [Simiduia agarivorans]AFU98356.2 hypothetical protein M5M_05765 [Simiduia agarivorans SA1 = DSM 21679]
MKPTFNLTSTLAACALACGTHFASATEQENGQYLWTFLSGQPWPLGYNQNTGKPDNLIYARDQYPTEFFQRIQNALPESRVNEAFMTDDAGSNIVLKEEGEVFVTFLHEGAGYKNSFGYFVYDPENPPQTPADVREIIVFPNLSYPHLTNGHRLSLGRFPAGTHIGFFIAANGFWYDTGVKPNAVPYYYSLKNLNPDTQPIHKQHNVLLYDTEVQEVIIGFEDLPRAWGDNDFNDAVFSVKATPSTAIDPSNLVTMPEVNDKDADGVPDSEDEFPDNFRRAFSSYFPSANDVVTLAFEDNWPEKGDYDLNDLVVAAQQQTIYNADGAITGMRINGEILARGADHHNGFALRLMGIAPSALKDANLTIAGETFGKTAESGQSDLVLILWQDSHQFTGTGESGQCSHFNTVKDCAEFPTVPFTLDINFNDSPTSIAHSTLDYFIFRTNFRGREIHFANYAPTDKFDATQFGKFDDTSNANTGRFFRSADNLPWALQINSRWRYPREYIDVLWAYPAYEQWVESSGQDAVDWFLNSDRVHHYY